MVVQRAVRSFLKIRRSFDVLPLSYRLIVLDTALLIKKSLNILQQNGALSSWISQVWTNKSKQLSLLRYGTPRRPHLLVFLRHQTISTSSSTICNFPTNTMPWISSA